MSTAYKLVNHDYTSMLEPARDAAYIQRYRFNIPNTAHPGSLGLFCYTHKLLAIRVAKVMTNASGLEVRVLEVEGHNQKPNPGLVANINTTPLEDYYRRLREQTPPLFQDYEVYNFGEDWKLFETVIPLWELVK